CYGELHYAELGRAHHVDFPEYFASELSRLETLAADGLVALEPGALRVLPRGRFLLRNVAMPFDAYLPGGRDGYSRVI
ncbi:MAG: hypothetical protein ACRD3W_23870, partial [Terriglobales bacterium]